MEHDPEYARAVYHLGKRECVAADVHLFNSHSILHGIDMGVLKNVDTTAIVGTNKLREGLNNCKASANTASIGTPTLAACASNDILLEGTVMTTAIHNNLINRVFSSLKGSLPGAIPFYEGMPVIYKGVNMTEIKVTNGLQGTVMQVNTAVCSLSFMYAKYILVSFPDCPLKLPGSLCGWVNIESSIWSLTITNAVIKDHTVPRFWFKWYQVHLQPGFTITGHSAQGKTLLKVLASLCIGGHTAYVTASRAKSHKGLFILAPVTLAHLNKPLHPDLLCKMQKA